MGPRDLRRERVLVPAREPRRARVRIDPSDLALEIVSIVIAIILATVVGQLVERYQAAERTREALSQIRQEVVRDHGALRDVSTLHESTRAAFDATIGQAREEQLDYDAFAGTFRRVAPKGSHPFDGSTTAWDLARSSNVLDGLPYSLRATLQRRYAELAQLRSLNAALYSHLTSAPTERRPNFFFTAAAVLLTLADIVASEDRLARDDDAVLSALAARGIQ
jgi:hypothetical protein